YVVAVSPVAGDVRRVVMPVEGGRFAATLDTGRPWSLVFVDDQMTRAVFQADALDTMIAPVDGSIDLGHVTITGAVASSKLSADDIRYTLGLDAPMADWIGNVDDLALRYSNPDLDGDGVIDAVQ